LLENITGRLGGRICSYSVQAQVNSGQYIHHPSASFFSSPPDSKLNAKPAHDSSNVIDIEKKAK
jgi:hypothetical protein